MFAHLCDHKNVQRIRVSVGETRLTSWGGTGVCVVRPGPTAGILFHFPYSPWVLYNLPHCSLYIQLCNYTERKKKHLKI